MMFQGCDILSAPKDAAGEEIYNPSLKAGIAEKALKRIIALASLNNKPAKILEVGTGDGILASRLIKRGFSYQGVEPSFYLYQNSINCFPELKGKVRNCSLEGAGFLKSSFDLVIMIDTLEHIPGPLTFLERARDYISCGGMLYVEVPNESFLPLRGVLRKAIGLYSGFPTHRNHLSLFTPLTIKKMMQQANLGIKAAGQLTVLGDYQRMAIILGERQDFLARMISLFFQLTKLDILFQQGNIFMLCYKKNG